MNIAVYSAIFLVALVALSLAGRIIRRKNGDDNVPTQSPSAEPIVIASPETETTTVEIPNDGMIWALNGKDGFKRATVMTLNGRDLVLGENWELPDLSGAPVAAGKVELEPMSCTFLVV